MIEKLPFEPATALPITAVPSYKVTVVPISAAPVNLRLEAFVGVVLAPDPTSPAPERNKLGAGGGDAETDTRGATVVDGGVPPAAAA